MDAPQKANPFPGLRPFEPGESHLFFGREGQSDELLARLRRKRFLAVVGTSGSGKSSLVLAGLLPALHGGLMAGGGGSWQVACFRPGNDPLGNLARSLAGIPGFVPAGDCLGLETGVEATLRRSGLGLLDAGRQARMPAGQNLLVVVDQFEELFRFKQSVDAGRSGDAAAFVKLLLEATAQSEIPIYGALTMRSDYLGDCAQFRDLPERLNDAQYLIPRMTRDQRREAITGPVLVGGGRIAPRLVQRLLNDVGDNPDQLPILQHALMRTWELWARHGGEEIDFAQYETIGEMASSLSHHADEAYGGLSAPQQALAEILFKRLTEKDPDGREIRRPARLGELSAAAQAPEEEVRAVIEAFRCEGRSFLMPGAAVPLQTDTMVDISHESLIRGWDRLKIWVNEEAQSAAVYRRLADAAARHAAGQASLFRAEDLAQARDWRAQSRPNAVWAARYDPGFDLAMSFLDASQREHLAEARRKERERRLLRWLAATLFVFFAGAVVLALYALHERNETNAALAESYWTRASHARRDGELGKAVHFSGLYARSGDNEPKWTYSAINAQHGTKALLLDTFPEVSGLPASARRAEFTRDGRRLVVYTRERFQLWDLENRRRIGEEQRLAGLGSPVFSDDGALLLTWGDDGTAQLWRDGSRTTLLTLQDRAPMRGGAFSQDGSRVVTWNDKPAPPKLDATRPHGTPDPPTRIELWRTADGSKVPLAAIGHGRHIVGAALRGDGQRLLVWTEKTAELWDVQEPSAAPLVITPDGGVRGARLSEDGQLVLTWKAGAQLWSASDGSPVPSLTRRRRDVIDALFAGDRHRVLTLGADGFASLWNLDDPAKLPLRISDKAVGVELSRDQRFILTLGADGAARLWDAGDGFLEAELLHGGPVGSARLVGGHRILTWAAEDGIRRWEVERDSPDPHRWDIQAASPPAPPLKGAVESRDGWYRVEWEGPIARLRTLKGGTAAPPFKLGHKDSIVGALFSPQADQVLTWSKDGFLRLWKTADGRLAWPPLHQDITVQGAAFREDGLIVSWDDDCVRLSNQEDSSPMVPPMRHRGRLLGAAFSPADGSALLTTTDDGGVRRWDIGADFDFPREHWPLLVEVATGTMVDDETGMERALSPEEWGEKRADYIKIAAEHLRTCKDQGANLYLRQKRLW